MHRPWGLLLLGALMAAACGGDDTGPSAGPITTVTPGLGTGPLEAPAGAETTAPRAGPPGVAGVGPVTTVAPGPGTPTTPAADDSIPLQRVGQLAPFLLRPGHGGRIVVEVRAQAGAEPWRATIDHLVRVLQAASGKQILVDGIDVLDGSGEAWTAASLSAMADRAATASQGGDQTVLRLLFVRGSFEGQPGVLGAAVRGDVAAVFADQVERAAGVLVDPAVVEDAVTVHEVGHLLGLVDLIVGSGRADPEHPGHSRNRDSVMYWAVENDAISQLLSGGIPNELDADDRAELAAIRHG
jgi:hypothetical protein